MHKANYENAVVFSLTLFIELPANLQDEEIKDKA